MKIGKQLAAAIAIALALPAGRLLAEEPAKPLPTLLIKGEVVSFDKTDPAASLIKVRDRYGFETPIFITGETKVLQADGTASIDQVGQGANVDVEYNFDVNTAKRYAVSVKLSQAKATEPTAPPMPAPPEPQAQSVPETTPTEPAAAPEMATEPSEPTAQQTEPAAQ